MNKTLTLIFSLLFFTACTTKNTTENNKTTQDSLKTIETNTEIPKLTVNFKWQTDSVLQVPESVIYDAERNQIYVSNINGKPTDKDGNGFISVLNVNGDITNLKWIENLDAPKGMGIYNTKLYVTNITELVEIDIDKALITNRFVAKSSQFLNDVTIDNNGLVYVSDMTGKKVYRLKQGAFDVWFDATDYQNPNGLWFQNEMVYLGVNNHVLEINPQSAKAKILISETGPIDGLVKFDDNKRFIISDWAGAVTIIQPNKPNKLVFDTSTDKINAADIDYVPEMKLLLVPTFFANKITAYTVILE